MRQELTMGKYGKGDTGWYTHDRFGMFIVWGLYSLAARHEWVRNFEQMSDEEYQKYFDLFCPDMFNPKEWAKAAKEAGMTYFVITTKHHEGFCLWDSKWTDYKAPNTPIGKDLLREVVDAFRAEGLHVGFYYSLIDWHHPDFTLDCIHPMRNRAKPEEFNKGRNMKRYAKYMRDQVTELLTNYGKVDIMWFDFSYPGENGKGRDDWESEKLVKLVRKLQPDIIIDNRLDLPGSEDIVTPEQYTPDKGMVDENGNPVVWEGCHTFSGSWGYHRDEATWKSSKMCIEMLINHVSRGGNLLMNVGPTSRGYIDQRAMDRLAAYAFWMKYNARSIYGCGQAPAEFVAPSDCRYTYNAETKRLYLHLFSWPFKHIHLAGLADKIKYAQLLCDGSEIKFRTSGNAVHTALNSSSPENALTLELPVVLPQSAGEVPVIELFLK
ncbi:MAG: alpha-L-fucosidase [Lentisphaeria bacterium]|nr:alpha-L-fucosidase [Lentisphaeria bacterium]